jgi:uncharacterized protein YpmS
MRKYVVIYEVQDFSTGGWKLPTSKILQLTAIEGN